MGKTNRKNTNNGNPNVVIAAVKVNRIKRPSNADIAKKLEEAVANKCDAKAAKSERDFLIENLNKDCIGKVFRGVERLGDGSLRICWDKTDEEIAKDSCECNCGCEHTDRDNCISGTFHSNWANREIGVRNGADVAYLLNEFIQLASREDFNLFMNEFALTARRMNQLGIEIEKCFC